MWLVASFGCVVTHHLAHAISLKEFGVTTVILTPGTCGRESRASVDDTGLRSSDVCPKQFSLWGKTARFCQKTFETYNFHWFVDHFVDSCTRIDEQQCFRSRLSEMLPSAAKWSSGMFWEGLLEGLESLWESSGSFICIQNSRSTALRRVC